MNGPPEQVERLPYDSAIFEINTVAESLRGIESLNGRPRALDGPTAIGALTARSNLAVAAALLAIADALRDRQGG